MGSKRRPADTGPVPIAMPPRDPAAEARDRALYLRMQLVQLLGASGTRTVEKLIADVRTLEGFVKAAGDEAAAPGAEA